MARALVLALAVSLLAVSGASGADAQTPKRGGTLVSLRPELACLNPFACNLQAADPALMQVLEGAFEAGPDLDLRPNLVSRVDIGRDPFTLTYHIRSQARWSDGRPITASDFLFTHQMFSTVPTLGIDRRPVYKRIARARVLDRKTFRVVLREPFADWRTLYDYVLPRHALAGRDLTKVWIDRIDDPRTGSPIGSGPFLVSRFERGARLTLVRNPRYWGPHTSYLDRHVFAFVKPDPGDPLGPLRRNEFHLSLFLGFTVTADVARDIRKLPGWRIVAWPATSMEHLVFRVGSGGHPALQNKLVRRALAYGIDRVAIAREIQFEADPALRRPLDSSVFLPTEPYYRSNWSGYRYDIPRARRLLTQAGCRRGADGIFACAGQRLTLRFVTTAGDSVRERTLELAQTHLRRVGVEVVLTFAPRPAVFGQILPGGQYDAGLFAWVTGGRGVAWPESRCGDVQNWSGFCSRLVMRDVQQVDRIVDPAQRARVLNAADAKLARAVPVLPVVQPLIRAVVRSNVRGIVPGGSQFEFAQTSEDWWLAEQR